MSDDYKTVNTLVKQGYRKKDANYKTTSKDSDKTSKNLVPDADVKK